jgi:WD40 repeat protein
VPPFPLHRRIVEIIADRGAHRVPRYLHGSGCLVAGRTVLTAAHVVTDAEGVLIRDTDKTEYRAVIDSRFVPHGDGSGPDLALVEIADEGMSVPPMAVAAVNRNGPTGSPIRECYAIGYPEFMEHDDTDGRPVRETAQAVGYIPVLSGMVSGLLSLEVSSSPAPLPAGRGKLEGSPWSGMSGAPVVAQDCLIGVVTGHAQRAGPSVVMVTPLTAISTDQVHPRWGGGVPDPGAWWARLGVAGVGELRMLPRPRQAPPYMATVQVIHGRTKVLRDRRDELAQIAAFATGNDGYLWLVGQPYAGKTALFAHAAMSAPDDTDVICYFLSRREASADSVGFLSAVIAQLAHLLDGPIPPTVDLHEFRSLWRQAADRAAAEHRHLLLVVDGLDEDLHPDQQSSIASLLPEEAGGHCHVLVSSRPHPPIPVDVDNSHPIRGARQVQLQPFAEAHEEQKLAKQEIDNLLRNDGEIGHEILGLLTVAAGPLAAVDLAEMMTAPPDLPARIARVQQLLNERVGRSMQEAAPAGGGRYLFGHDSLLEYVQSRADLNHPSYRSRIHEWSDKWQALSWPVPDAEGTPTPQYLLDVYPTTLADAPERLERLVSDVGWVEAAIISAGVDHVLAHLRRVVAANPARTEIQAMLATVSGQAHNLRDRQLLGKPGYVLRQIWLQAAQLADGALADQIRERLRLGPGRFLLPLLMTSRAEHALSAELGHEGPIDAAVVLRDGRVVTSGRVLRAGSAKADGRVLVWDPGTPGMPPTELGNHEAWGNVMAVLADGRIATSGEDGVVLLWDPDAPGATPIELGRHGDAVRSMAVATDGRIITGSGRRLLAWDPKVPGNSPVELHCFGEELYAVAALPDGRFITGGQSQVDVLDPDAPGTAPTELGRHKGVVNGAAVLPDGRIATVGWDCRVLVWDLTRPGTGPAELGRNKDYLYAVAALPDGRVVTRGRGDRVQVWDPDAPGMPPIELGYHSHGGMVSAIAVLPDGRVVTTEHGGRVVAWNPDAPQTGPVGPSDCQVASTDGHVSQVCVWNPDARGTNYINLGDRLGLVDVIAVLPDGRIAAIGKLNGRVLIWNPDAPGTLPIELGRLGGWLQAVAVLPDGRIATAAGMGDDLVQVWDPDAPGMPPIELGHRNRKGKVDAIAVLPDGRIATIGSSGRLVWDPDAPSAPVELGHRAGIASAVAVLSDGRVVTFENDFRTASTRRQMMVCDLDAPATSRVKLGHRVEWAHAAGVLPDNRIVTAGDDGRVLLWDPDHPGMAPVELGRHEAAWNTVYALAVLEDGRIVTAGDGITRPDNRVLLWDADHPGMAPIELVRHRAAWDAARPLGVLGDGRIVTAGEEGRVLVWNPSLTTEPELCIKSHVRFIATSHRRATQRRLVLTHPDGGFSVWSLMGG